MSDFSPRFRGITLTLTSEGPGKLLGSGDLGLGLSEENTKVSVSDPVISGRTAGYLSEVAPDAECRGLDELLDANMVRNLISCRTQKVKTARAGG
jgi:hypothetical protein